MIDSNFKIRTGPQNQDYSIGYARQHCKKWKECSQEGRLPNAVYLQPDCKNCPDLEKK